MVVIWFSFRWLQSFYHEASWRNRPSSYSFWIRNGKTDLAFRMERMQSGSACYFVQLSYGCCAGISCKSFPFPWAFSGFLIILKLKILFWIFLKGALDSWSFWCRDGWQRGYLCERGSRHEMRFDSIFRSDPKIKIKRSEKSKDCLFIICSR